MLSVSLDQSSSLRASLRQSDYTHHNRNAVSVAFRIARVGCFWNLHDGLVENGHRAEVVVGYAVGFERAKAAVGAHLVLLQPARANANQGLAPHALHT